MPTVRQIAALSGYSRSTVSLALRNHPSIPDSTRRLITDLAIEHGYKPDPVVASLMGQLRTRKDLRPAEKLAYLTSWNTAEGWKIARNDTMWFRGACQRADALGYEIEHFWAKEPRMSGARLSKILYTRGIRGLIFAPLVRARGHLSLNWNHFAAAAISFTAIKPDLHRASHSHLTGMKLAIRRLRRLGYRRIGLAILQQQIGRVNDGWLAPYVLYQQSVSPRSRVPALMQKEWNVADFEAWVKKYRVDVVLSNMLEPLQFLEQLGYRVPEDVGFASLDRGMESEVDFSCVDQLPEVVGAAAVDLVIGQLQRNEFGLPMYPQTLMLNGVWRDGATLRRRPSAAAPLHDTKP